MKMEPMKRSLPTPLRRNRYQPATAAVQLPEPAGALSSWLFLSVPMFFVVLMGGAAIGLWALSPLTWYLARATGITLYLLFWGSIVLGLSLTSRWLNRRVSRSTLLSLHSYLSRLAYAFLAAHILSLVIDRHLPFSIEQLVVPFESTFRQPWTGFGILAMYLFAAVVASVSFRRYIPYRVWRALHVLAFPMYALALLHGIGAGSSSGSMAMKLVYLVTAVSVAVLCFARIATWDREQAAIPRGVPRRRLDRLGGQTTVYTAPSERAR